MNEETQARFKVIDARLEEWADYIIQRVSAGLGYSSRTVEWELQRMGGVIISGTGQRIPQVNERAEEIEWAVVRLPEELRNVATIRYLLHSKYPTDEHKCKYLGYSKATYRINVNQMYTAIWSYLDGLKDQRERVAL